MATLLNRFKNAAATATTLSRSATPTSASTSSTASSPSSATQHTSFVKRHLYINPVMSVSIVFGTLGVVVPTIIYLMDGGRENERTGRLDRWKTEWQQSGEEARKQTILKEMGDRKDDRLTALRNQLQTSSKYTAPQ